MGYLSLINVQTIVARRHGQTWSWIFALVSLVLSGFAIYRIDTRNHRRAGQCEFRYYVTASSELLTATATDPSGNTSEFSPCATAGSIGFSLGDVSAVEGNSGTTSLSFPLTLQSAATQDVVVTFATQVGSAVPSVDFVANSGTVTIPAGQMSGQIVVQVNGDTDVEDDEQFFVNLTAATNAVTLDAQGKGTILNDDEIRLLLEETGPAADQAAALESVLFLRDPFRVVNPANMVKDQFNPNTGVIVFAQNLTLAFLNHLRQSARARAS